MFVQLTNAGAALLNANTGPITLTTAKFGSGVNYVPQPTDTNIHGTVVFTTVPTAPLAANGNIVKYSVYADYNAASFAFGEFGLFTANGTLFALGASTELIQKIQMTSLTVGNSIRLDVFLSMVNQNYEMWLDIAESNNEFRAAVLGSPDQLPPPQDATPNLYIISGYNSQQSGFFAFTDRQGLWNFDAYAYANQANATITGFDYQSVVLALSQYVPGMTPAYTGSVILEFTSGKNYGICRYVTSAVISGGQVTLGFDSPLAQTPIVGDTFRIYGRQALSTTIPNLPIATTTTLGAVVIGTTLTVDSTGLINVAASAFPVRSVNGMTGDVLVNAANLPGLATVGKTGSYNDLTNKPAAYTLPFASTTVLGGVKAPTDGNLTVAGDGTIDLGFSPVKTVNGTGPDGTGNVVVTLTPPIGLVTPKRIVAATDFNTLQTTGIFFALDADVASLLNAPTTVGGTLDIEPFTTTASGGDVIQRYTTATGIFVRRYTQSTNTWGSWTQMATVGAPVVATTTSLGVVQIGTGLNITGPGVLSTVIQSVNSKVATNVVLTAADVGAIPITAIDIQNGVAGLDVTPNSPALATDVYTYGRIRFYDNTLGTLWDAGKWDASANHLIQTGSGLSSPDTSTALVAGGLQTIDMSYGGANARVSVSPTYATVNAEGMVYVVSVAGTTSLDGIASWAVGDLALVIQGAWRKIAGPNSTGVTTFNTRSGAVTLSGADISAATGALLTDVAAAKYYDVPGGAANAITASELLLQHVAARTLNFASNFANSRGYAATAPTASVTLTVAVNGSTVGTIVFAASSQTSTFTTSSGALTVTPGQVLTVTAPASADATFANVSFTLLGLAT